MIIYKITNTVTNRSYIGYTKQDLNVRWKQHYTQALKENKNRKFYNAIRKYGISSWTTEVLDETDTVSAAKAKEVFYIEKFNTYNFGYNATKGGDGNNGIIMSEKSNRARSKKLKGKKKSAETIAKFKQRKHTDESRQKISMSHIGKKKPWVKWTEEQCRARGLTRRAITECQYKQIHSMRAQGYKIKDIASESELSVDMVKKWLKMEW